MRLEFDTEEFRKLKATLKVKLEKIDQRITELEKEISFLMLKGAPINEQLDVIWMITNLQFYRQVLENAKVDEG